MINTFTLKRLTSLFFAFFVCLFASAEVITLNFSEAPFKELEGKNTFQNKGSVEVNGIKIETIQKNRLANRISDGVLTFFASNSLKITAPEGKPIKKVLFKFNDQDFILDAEPGSVTQVDDEGNKFWEWRTPIAEVLFKNQTRSSSQHIAQIEITIDNPEVTFDFENLNPAWDVEDVPFGEKDWLRGKIADGKEIVQDNVVMTTVNTRTDRSTRVLDHKLQLPVGHQLTFTAPEGKIIAKVEFTIDGSRSALQPQGWQAEMPLKNKVATYSGNTNEVTFTAFKFTPKIRKIVVTLAPEPEPEPVPEPEPIPDGIATAQIDTMPISTNVYNLSGVVVGTTLNFNALPSGVYIINGKKYIK